VDIMLVLVVLLVVVLIWRGPTMLPRLGEAMGKTVKGVRENLPGTMGDDADPDDKNDSDAKPGS
jgi:Sec-independent protein translocase protein TatA